jgi:hypothetical protein
MPINLSKINGALDRLNPETRSQSNNNTNTSIVKLEEGKSNIRIVPYIHDMEMPFQELHFHYGVGGKTFLCPKRMKGEDCPICDMATEAWSDFTNTGDESSKEVFKKLVATLRVFIPIVVRGEEDQGVRWWAVSPRTTYKEILNKVKDALSEGIDITDTSEGLDLIVRVEKGYNGWLIPESVDMSLRPSKLIDGNVDELLNTVTKIDELYTYRPISDMKEALSSFVNGSQEEDNSTGFTKTYSNDESKNDIDFDTKSSGKSVMEKFDQALGGE